MILSLWLTLRPDMPALSTLKIFSKQKIRQQIDVARNILSDTNALAEMGDKTVEWLALVIC